MAKRFEKAKAYTQAYQHVLLPCRHCGSTDIRVLSDRTIFPPKDVWFVACSTPSCDCTASFSSVRRAVQRWNQQQSHPL